MQVDPRTLRRVIGVLGISLPVILWLFGGELQGSISAYHNTHVGPVFSGILFTVGWYLFAYKGYEKQDDVAGDIACFAAIGVAVFPHDNVSTKDLHFTFAIILFFTLVFFCCLFTKGHTTRKATSRKRRRNWVYWICAGVMMICLIALAILICYGVPGKNPEATMVFWLESALLWAFGVAWFVKGTNIPGLRD